MLEVFVFIEFILNQQHADSRRLGAIGGYFDSRAYNVGRLG
jgi:hypothetical protein